MKTNVAKELVLILMVTLGFRPQSQELELRYSI